MKTFVSLCSSTVWRRVRLTKLGVDACEYKILYWFINAKDPCNWELGKQYQAIFPFCFLWRKSYSVWPKHHFQWTSQGMVFLPKVMKCQLKKWRDIESQLISSPVIELYVLQGHDTLLILLHNQHVWANIFHKIEVRPYRSFCANVSLCCRNKPWPIWLLRGCVWVIC